MASSPKKRETFVDRTYQNDFMKTAHQLRQNGEYIDMTLQSGDVYIPCHRLVLAVASDYFKSMFRCSFDNTSDTVLVTVESDIMTSIVDYMYTGEVELTVVNVCNLVKACDVFQLDSLKAGCERFMEANVDISNCVRFDRIATSYQLRNVQVKAKRFMLTEFKSVAFSDQFKEMSCKELIEFIKDDNVSVENEDEVFASVLDWVGHDRDNRKSSLVAVLEHVRLPFCTSHYLWQVKDTCDMLTTKCLEYLQEAWRFQADSEHQHRISSCRTVPRTKLRMKSCLLVAGGLTCSEDETVIENNVCQYYNENTSCWETLTEMPQSVGQLYSVCYLGRSLLLTGGIKEDALDQCWLYDFVWKKWEEMPPLITARYFHRSVCVGDCVYVVGGIGVGDNNILVTCECFRLKHRQWMSMPDIPHAVSGPMVVTYGSRIFVFGGRNIRQENVICTQVFDSTRRQWCTQSEQPVICDLGAAITLNDFIYVVGSFSCTCLKYDPATDTWTTLSPPREEHGNAPAVVYRGCILVAGGGSSNLKSSFIEQYCPLTDTWSDWKSELGMKLTAHNIFNVDLYGV